jgi:hypothetical protein
MKYVDFSQAEFGNSISAGLWIPYLYKNSGNEIGVYSKIPFNKTWTDQWYDDFIFLEKSIHHINNGESTEKLLLDKRHIQKLVIGKHHKLVIPADKVQSIPLPDFKNKIKEKYVVIIPNVYEWMLSIKKTTVHPWRWNRSLTLENWIKIRDLLHEHKIKIIGFGCMNSCSKEHLKLLSDQHYFFDRRSVKKINNVFVDQLKWMKNALCTIALGGAMHTHFSFEDLSLIGYDPKIHNAYKNLIRSLKMVREDLHFLQNPVDYAIQNDLFEKEGINTPLQFRELNPEQAIKANDMVKMQIIEKIKEILL